MRDKRYLNSLGTLWKRTEPQRDVLEAWFHWAYSPSVRISYVTPVIMAIAFATTQAHPLGMGVMVFAGLLPILLDWRSPASGVAYIKIDGATHAETHVLCRSGLTIEKDQDT